MDIKPLKIGVLGTANIALRSVIPLLESMEQYELVAVASRSKEKIEDKQFFETLLGYETLLNEKKLDAIYIPLPNSLHYEWIKKALSKGIHVLVEKSLACDLEQVKELNSIARGKNLALIENFQFRFHSQLEYIKKVIKAGTLGDLRIVRSSFCFPPFKDKNNIRYKKELGGGALLDAGAYPIKLSQIFLGEELEIDSAVLNFNEDFEVDIWGGATLKQKNGNLFSQVAFGFDHYYQCNLELVGSEGKLYTNRIFTAGNKIIPRISIETNQNGLQVKELEPDDHFQKMLLYFYDVVTGVKPKETEYTSNINQSRLLQGIWSKSKNKR
jgi:dTDP-3,4-didehydro-2,6-dideoxy-alpha-D-glucose 3-reductase